MTEETVQTERVELSGGVFAGILLLSAAVLALEVYLTRVYSLMVWPYMAFVVVSVAMLGIGAAGAVLAAAGARWGRRPPATMAACAVAFGATALVGTAAVGHFPANLGRSLLSPDTHLPVVAYYLISAMPFFFAGFVFALAFRAYPARAHKIYFFDLLGAAAGAFAVVAAMNVVGGAGTLAAITVLAAAAAAAFAGFRPKGTVVPVVLAVVAVVAAVAAPSLFHVKPSPQKFLAVVSEATGARVENSYWNALGRVDVMTEGDGDGAAPLGAFRGLSAHFRGPYPDVKWITIDGGAETPIIRFDGDFDKLTFLEHYLPALSYQLKSPETVLIIGPGGGVDVLAALKYGARHMEGAELNPGVVAINRDHYADFNGGLFNRPEVELHEAEGRSFVRGSSRRYDLIQLSLVDTFTAAASGAHALSENYLYTVEAFRDYYRHLRPGGVITVIRNYFTFGHESLRLVTLAYDALEAEGEPDPARCFAIFTNGFQANVIVKRGGFSDAEVDELQALAAGKFEPLWLPGKPCRARAYERIYRDWRGRARLFIQTRPFTAGELASFDGGARQDGYRLLYASTFLRGLNEFSAFLLEDDKPRFYRRYFYDVRPPDDNKPFYFLTSKWRNLYLSAAVAAPPGFIEGTNFVSVPHAAQFFLVIALLEAAVLSALLILAPALFFRRRKVRIARKGAFAAYFLLLGVGFMFIEIPLIQKFTLYLGHPVYAFATALAVLLAASGAGSLASERFRERWWIPFAAVAALAVLLPFLTDRLTAATLGWPLGARITLVVAQLAPLGFFLGMPFPLGITVIAAREKASIPWAWAANGCASVVGPAAAVLLAATEGHNVVLFAAAAAYALAWAAFYRASRAPLEPAAG